MAEDGAEVKEGERVAEFDPTRLVQTIEERRLRLRQAEIDRESRERSAEAERERKRVAVEKAEVEAEKARLDAEIPLEYRDPIDRPKIRAQWQQAQAALEKARLEREAYEITSRADVAAARAAEDKARREVEASEKALGSMSLAAPQERHLPRRRTSGSGARRARASCSRATRVWPGYTVASIPDPSADGGVGRARRVRPRAHRARGSRRAASSTRTPTACSPAASRRSAPWRRRAARRWFASACRAGSRCASRSSGPTR